VRTTLIALLITPVLTACEPEPSMDTGLQPDGGCVLDLDHFQNVSIEPTDIPTVFEAVWTTTEPGRGRVAFAAGGGSWSTGWDQGELTEHRALLVGAPAQSEVLIRLVSEIDGEQRCSDHHQRSTPAPPAELPVLELDADYRDAEPGGWALVPVGTDGATIVALVDAHGRYCWWLDNDSYYFYADTTPAGDGLLLLDSSSYASGSGRVLEIGFDGQLRREVEVASAHNHLAQLPDGTVLILGREEYEAEIAGAPVLLHSDTVIALAPDGSQEQLWSAREDLLEQLTPMLESRVEQGQPEPIDWTHGTGLSYDPHHEQLLVVLTGTNAVVGLDLPGGELAWIMGGMAATVDGTHGTIEVPHSVQALTESVLVFNQRAHSDDGECGEAVELGFDRDAMAVTEVWIGVEPDCSYPDVMGSAHRTADGGTLVAGGSLGRLSWFDHSGALVWRLHGELGTTFGGTSHVAAFP